MRKHVFISYDPSNHAFAEQLISQVQTQFTTWIDNERQDPAEGIYQAIRDAFALIVIISPTAAASVYVTSDWAFACGCGTKVIPVVCQSASLHPRLEELSPLDFTSQYPWDDLMNVLQTAARESSAF